MEPLLVLSFGNRPRMETALGKALTGQACMRLDAAMPLPPLQNRRLFFAVALDNTGLDPALCAFLAKLRREPHMLEGCLGAMLIDGEGELYTKQMAHMLALSSNLAGCAFPGRALVEATGSMANLNVQAKRRKLSLEETYHALSTELVTHLLAYSAKRAARPKLLMLHASDHRTSNTLAIGRALIDNLKDCFDIREISLQNGALYDCRGCSYKDCAHFAAQNTCFYGGSMVEEVHPAIMACDALLLLCPNYNDSVSANIMACINRLTSLQIHNSFFEKSLYAVVVSGYSGGDLVAQQVLGALSLNKGFALPPRFCLMQTANDPGEAMQASGIESRVVAFAGRMAERLCMNLA